MKLAILNDGGNEVRVNLEITSQAMLAELARTIVYRLDNSDEIGEPTDDEMDEASSIADHWIDLLGTEDDR